MTDKNNNNGQILTAEDMKIISYDPLLADYVAKTKIKSAKKTAWVIATLVAVVAFLAGLFTGMAVVSSNTPNNVNITVEASLMEK